jgi:hypothetical protein
MAIACKLPWVLHPLPYAHGCPISLDEIIHKTCSNYSRVALILDLSAAGVATSIPFQAVERRDLVKNQSDTGVRLYLAGLAKPAV